jgi:hypothetical protein
MHDIVEIQPRLEGGIVPEGVSVTTSGRRALYLHFRKGNEMITVQIPRETAGDERTWTADTESC